MMDRCGLEWYRVEADVGMMGGFGAHEYMAPCPAGENEVALGRRLRGQRRGGQCRPAQPVAAASAADQPELVDTPGMTTVEQVARALGVPQGALLKAFPVMVDADADEAGRRAR